LNIWINIEKITLNSVYSNK